MPLINSLIESLIHDITSHTLVLYDSLVDLLLKIDKLKSFQYGPLKFISPTPKEN